MRQGGLLVVRGGAVGDFILTLPVLAALRRRFPGAPVTVMGRPGTMELARAGGLAETLLSIESRGLAGFLVRDGELDPGLAAQFAGQSLIVSYLYDPEGIFRENLGRCSRARLLTGPSRPDESLPVHAADALFAPLLPLGLPAAPAVPRLRLPAPPPLPAAPLLAVHPGSGSPRKNWPEAGWGALLSRLAAETSLRFLLIGGEAEGDRAARLAAPLPPARTEVAQGLPLVELARRLAGAGGFVGHDSGITHLAAALGVPGVVLWGESNLEVWRPRGSDCRILRDARGLAALSVEAVASALAGMLGEIGKLKDGRLKD